jgi:UDP-N-acetylglucosamine kinase
MSYNEQYLFLWAKENRKELCKKFFAEKKIPEGVWMALFMAGSPWAGKTEFIRRLLSPDDGEALYYILDLDIIRWWMPWYTWYKADEYTKWAVKILEMMFDECVNKKYPFILDGTFTSTWVMDKNISRLINKDYIVTVFYIHTIAEIAWLYTLYRWKDEWRCIPVGRFVRDYLLAPKNVCELSKKYASKVKVFIVNKEYKFWDIDFAIELFDNKESIDDFFDKNTFIDYTIKDKVSKFNLYRNISFIPFIWKKFIRYKIKKMQDWLSREH